MDATDEQLVAQAKLELPYNTQAFEELLRRYELRVFNTCMRYLNNVQDAEETSQEIFLRVFHALAKFKGDSTFKTWLFRIAVNTSLTRREKIARRAKQSQTVSQVGNSELLQVLADDASLEIADMGGPLSDAFDSISSEDRVILVLRYISELQISEIAEVLNLKESAAKMRVSRAVQRLKAAYNKSRQKESPLVTFFVRCGG